jgi:hypothetical protein
MAHDKVGVAKKLTQLPSALHLKDSAFIAKKSCSFV